MFAYCNNNPVNLVDYSGEACVNVCFGIDNISDKFMLYGGSGGGGSFALGLALASALATAIILDSASKSASKTAAPPIPAHKIEALEKEHEHTNKLSEKNPPIFTLNPYDFNPTGLIRRDITGSYNGKIIKWFDANNVAIFEWNEDLQYGAHYHILVNGKHIGDHIEPGTLVPEPYKSLYFGE